MPTTEQYLAAAFYEATSANLPIKWVENCTKVSNTGFDFYVSVLATVELHRIVQSHNENVVYYSNTHNENVNKGKSQ